MTFSRTWGIAAFALILGGAAVSGQTNRVPGPDLAGIAETKAMHVELVRAIETNTRAHIVIARLASQDARVAAAIAQVANAQRELSETTRARIAIEADIRQLSLEFPRLPPTDKSAASKELADKRGEANDLRRQETTMRAQLPKLQQSLAAEQARHNELSGRLDEMEKSLAPR